MPAESLDAPAVGVEHRLTRLPSGVRVVTAPMRERASATVAVMVGAGSRQEAPEEAGLAHFIEHMVFKGTQRWPTARHLSEAVEGVGGVVNAATDKEMTMFWAKVPATELSLAIDLCADMVFRAVLDEAELAKERDVVVEELRMYLDNPQDHVGVVFEELLWPGHPLGVDTAGTEATVRSFTRADCLRFLGERYHSPRLLFCATGAVEHEAVVERVAAVLGSWGEAAVPPWLPAQPLAATAERLRLVSRRTEQANLVVGARSRSYTDPDRYGVDLLTTVLGEGMSSRLFLALREDRGLAYDVHAYTVKHADSGALAIYIGCEPRRAAAATAAAVAELERLAREPVPEAELRKARRFTSGRLLLQLEGTSSLCTYLGQQELLTDEILSPAQVVAGIEAVSADDLRRLAAETLEGGLRGAVVGPFRSVDKFLKILT